MRLSVHKRPAFGAVGILGALATLASGALLPLVVLCGALPGGAAAAEPAAGGAAGQLTVDTLCRHTAGELTRFACSAGPRQAQMAVCQLPAPQPGPDAAAAASAPSTVAPPPGKPAQQVQLVLRQRLPGQPWRQIPPAGAQPLAQPVLGQVAFSGGGGVTLRFEHQGLTYTVYSLVSAQWGERHGVTVTRGDRVTQQQPCRNPRRIQALVGPALQTLGLPLDANALPPPTDAPTRAANDARP